ncbi:peptidylprolyl isomerase [Sphingomonas nostoxanthinifaciens]|uniref:peptidylprolyl isomerase n=1 Tax=Sphingomonas nostoxanthinifaciens TaxID=2872652 RepID=UPI001CC1E613|nr:peptidylprolyl isomerase [Sphingomonas nostoxanthinifaciens]UAK25807.1 peptidylprolyl isomerase [Sphingomonas nostoxanthinifaciens]
MPESGHGSSRSGDCIVPIIHLITDYGDVFLEIDVENTPLTADNFLRYVDSALYDGASFYRVVRSHDDPTGIPIDVIQGGIGRDSRAYPGIGVEATQATGLRHRRGTLSMARMVPGWSTALATSEFFICLSDAPELDFGGQRNGDGQGFAAFGNVVSGIDILSTMHDLPIDPDKMAGTSFAGQMLRDPPRILQARRA